MRRPCTGVPPCASAGVQSVQMRSSEAFACMTFGIRQPVRPSWQVKTCRWSASCSGNDDTGPRRVMFTLPTRTLSKRRRRSEAQLQRRWQRNQALLDLDKPSVKPPNQQHNQGDDRNQSDCVHARVAMFALRRIVKINLTASRWMSWLVARNFYLVIHHVKQASHLPCHPRILDGVMCFALSSFHSHNFNDILKAASSSTAMIEFLKSSHRAIALVPG